VSAKGTRRCFAETGPAILMSRMRWRKAPSRMDRATGEAECATTQIVHCASSPGLEWWCAAKPYADNNVSSRHSNAICFTTDRMKTYPTRAMNRIYNETWPRCNLRISTNRLLAPQHERSSPNVILIKTAEISYVPGCAKAPFGKADIIDKKRLHRLNESR